MTGWGEPTDEDLRRRGVYVLMLVTVLAIVILLMQERKIVDPAKDCKILQLQAHTWDVEPSTDPNGGLDTMQAHNPDYVIWYIRGTRHVYGFSQYNDSIVVNKAECVRALEPYPKDLFTD